MQKIVVLSLLISLSFAGNSQEVIRINLNEYKKHERQADLSEIASDISYIKLETNANCLLGDIIGIFRCNKNLLILGNSKKNLFLFSENGSFIRQIGNLGKGPGEFLEIYGLTIDPISQHIYILDNGQVKMLEFSEKGDFIKETKLGFYATNLMAFGPGFVFYTGSSYAYRNDGCVLTQTDKECKSIGKFHPIASRKGNPYSPGTLYPDNKEVCFWESIWDTVYAYNGTGVRPKYFFDQGKDRIPQKLQNNTKQMWSEIDKYFFLNGFKEFKNFIYFDAIDLNRKSIRIVYDKIKKDGYYLNFQEKYSNWGFNNNFSGGPLFSPNYKLSADEVACVYEMINLKELLSKGIINIQNAKNPDKFNELKSLINKSDDQDNPILIISKLK